MAYLLSQLLTESATLYPNQLAVVHEQDHYTYRTLDQASNRFANRLQQAGVGRGDRVGLYLEKSLDAVAALFGVLKAGAVYVPLDPAAPLQRIAYIVDNCQMKGVVSTTPKWVALQGKLATLNTTPQAILVDDTAALAKASIAPPLATYPIENDLAYILYTSGSTGNPKGVMISHRAALTFVDWACNTFNVQPTDRVSNHAPFHFDLSIFDLFATIKAGGTIVLVSPALSVFPRNLANFIAAQEISIWYSVPSALTRLLLHGQLERFTFPKLHTILFAGEVFPVKYLRQLMELLPHTTFHNLYGPTETNVCTWYSVPRLDPSRTEPISIGKACANSETFVLTEQNEIVQPGNVGELCVRGPALMSGYWGLPERTAQALTPLVVNQHLRPELIYHTGDLVREEVDGNYTYLGRRDNQIKSRGYRIELGEIETILYSHPDVEEAAVIPIADDEIGNQIKAFIVPGAGKQLLRSTLEAFCAERLPKYMLPQQFEFQATLPKTSTGKVDKVQLRQPTSDTATLNMREQVSKQIQQMWEKNWSNKDFMPVWAIREIPQRIRESVDEAWFPPQARLLDIGCGDGEIAHWLSEQNYSVLGVDLAPSAIQRAQQTFGEVPGKLEFKVADVCCEPSAVSEFDVLLDRGCLQGLPKNFYPNYAKTIANWARPAARFLLIYGVNLGSQIDATQEEKLYEEMMQRLETTFLPTFEIIKTERSVIERHDLKVPSPGLTVWMIRRS
ncbi:MAG: amino acid adenylation domain-containing protein [Caldilineaceae bacterium]